MEITVNIPQFVDLKSSKEAMYIEGSPFSYYPLSFSQTKKKQWSIKEHFEVNSNVLEESYTRLLLPDSHLVDNPLPYSSNFRQSIIEVSKLNISFV